MIKDQRDNRWLYTNGSHNWNY